MKNDDPLLTTREAAAFLRVSHRTLEDWRSDGRGPELIKYSRNCVLYERSALVAFRKAHTRKPKFPAEEIKHAV